jgi:hypothetical protein
MNGKIRIPVLIGMLLGALAVSGTAGATIIGGSVDVGSGSFIKLVPGFTESDPDNTVGQDTFQNTNLYGFDEDQNVQVVGSALSVDYLVTTGTAGSLPVGTVVASHYIFFDPAGTASQEGTVDFDSDILAIISSTGNLGASDYLANTGVTYQNPGLRGLEVGDSVTVSGAQQISVDWTASTPGDYVRVLTVFSPAAAAAPLPASAALALLGLCLLSVARRRPARR